MPTSYYANVQLRCTARIIDDPAAKARLLREQLRHFQPTGDHGPVEVGEEPYDRLLSGIRGVELTITHTSAKFKYDDRKPELQHEIAGKLNNRAKGRDLSAAAQQLRRHNRAG